ncbi:MAG: hypothetical protein GY702_02115 [Desulfobulbaceae bacterium]|nr:hypothetical protein [Desulfobulbaceae bacterium]
MKSTTIHRTFMDAVTENNLRQEQVESFGRLMAGFSHDLKNHLGIIRESNGLMSDLIEMHGFDENELLAERLNKAISSIESRVIIAADMLHHLSRFAHRPDTPCSSFLVNDIIIEEHTFLERFSRLQQINVTLELGEGLNSIYNDPALLQHVFYRMYILSLEQLSSGNNLVITTRQNQKTTEIIFRLTGNIHPTPKELPEKNIQTAIKKLEGSLEIVGDDNDQTDITLTVPSLLVEY